MDGTSDTEGCLRFILSKARRESESTKADLLLWFKDNSPKWEVFVDALDEMLGQNQIRTRGFSMYPPVRYAGTASPGLAFLPTPAFEAKAQHPIRSQFQEAESKNGQKTQDVVGCGKSGGEHRLVVDPMKSPTLRSQSSACDDFSTTSNDNEEATVPGCAVKPAQSSECEGRASNDSASRDRTSSTAPLSAEHGYVAVRQRNNITLRVEQNFDRMKIGCSPKDYKPRGGVGIHPEAEKAFKHLKLQIRLASVLEQLHEGHKLKTFTQDWLKRRTIDGEEKAYVTIKEMVVLRGRKLAIKKRKVPAEGSSGTPKGKRQKRAEDVHDSGIGLQDDMDAE